MLFNCNSSELLALIQIEELPGNAGSVGRMQERSLPLSIGEILSPFLTMISIFDHAYSDRLSRQDKPYTVP